jgi:putative ATPase
MAIEKAYKDVQSNRLFGVPLHLRNAPTRLMKNIGYGKEYKYPHDYDKHFIDENYFPDELKDAQYYFPTENGQEKSIKERLAGFWGKHKKY